MAVEQHVVRRSSRGQVSSPSFIHEDLMMSSYTDDTHLYMDEDAIDEYDKDAQDLVDKQLTHIEQEVLISSLLNSEEIAPVIGAVFQKSFADALARFAQERADEIVCMCQQDSALSFIQSVDVIAHVRVCFHGAAAPEQHNPFIVTHTKTDSGMHGTSRNLRSCPALPDHSCCAC
eukprot:2491351-Rhodomonas_salina.2